MKRKIVFFDIDGTLYDFKQGIPESTKEAIRLLVDNGHIPVICTGRTKAMIPQNLIDLGFVGIIAGAGTYVEYQGHIIHNKLEDVTFAKKVLPLLKEYNVKYILEGPEYIYYDGTEKGVYYGTEEFISKIMDRDKIKVIDYNDLQMSKLSCLFPEEQVIDELTPKLEEMFHLIPHQGTNFVELVPHGYNKATGIKTLIDYLNIDQQDTYAFGDSSNDLEMLEYVQYGIAMGNSYPEVLERARYKTKPINEDGIYHGLKEFGLI